VPHADTATTATPPRGLTVRDVARRYRVSPERVRAWLRRGELCGINTADANAHKPRFIIPVDALAAFERGRSAAVPVKPARRRTHATERDYYPD